MFTLAIIMTLAGAPDMQMEMEVGSKFACNMALKTLVDGNPPTIQLGGEYVVAEITDAVCVKK